ncbi:MAG TPA: hypothetical protein VGB64_15825 [Actinomycetota bacterium]
MHAERCAAAFAFRDFDGAAVQIDEAPDERETDAYARRVCPQRRPLPERLEDLAAELVGDAGSRVFDDDQPAGRCFVDDHPDRRAVGGVTGRVGHQVLDDAFDLGAVDVGDDRVCVHDDLASR